MTRIPSSILYLNCLAVLIKFLYTDISGCNTGLPSSHLVEKEKRIKALSEAKRVLKPNGIVFAAAMSKYASTIDGFQKGFVKDSEFQKIIINDLENGKHYNSTEKDYFTTAFLHHPDE